MGAGRRSFVWDKSHSPDFTPLQHPRLCSTPIPAGDQRGKEQPKSASFSCFIFYFKYLLKRCVCTCQPLLLGLCSSSSSSSTKSSYQNLPFSQQKPHMNPLSINGGERFPKINQPLLFTPRPDLIVYFFLRRPISAR